MSTESTTSTPVGPARVTTLPTLAPRDPDGNKGSYGKVLVIAGSRGMAGAAVLAASAALRGGAGLVRLAVPRSILGHVAAANPCYLTVPLPEDEDGRIAGSAIPLLIDLARASSVVALGPGLGKSVDLGELVQTVLARVERPVVLDADGINAVHGHVSWVAERAGPLVMTPHPGEFAGLIDSEISIVQSYREELSISFAAEHMVTLVLKGHRTVVTDGRASIYVNDTGNPGMATGGTGDVLTGLTAALIGQGLDVFPAAQLGVYLHGLAGDLARDEVGEVSLIASDLVDYLPRAFRTYQSRRATAQ